MIKLLNILILLFVTSVSAQNRIVGKVIDSESLEIIPYVNIGVKNKGIGTVSDKNGYFDLSLNKTNLKDEKVIFSHVGYTTRELLVSDLLNGINEIKLEADITQLDEVVINFKIPKFKKIGRKSKGFGLMHANFYTWDEEAVDDRLSKEMGMIFKIRKKCRIEGLEFNITGNEFKHLKFRVNFYRIDGKLPGDLLNTKDILFEIKDGYLGWYDVDFEDAAVYLDKDIEKVGVTIQWLESIKEKPKSKYFSLSTAVSTKKNFIQREKSMDKWFNIKASLSFFLKASCSKK